MAIRHGGLKEPYCSDACYDQAGKELFSAQMRNLDGPCAFCQRLTKVGSPGVLIFNWRSQFAFVCPNCHERVKNFVAEIKECCMCSTALTDTELTRPSEAIETQQRLVEELTDIVKYDPKSASTSAIFESLEDKFNGYLVQPQWQTVEYDEYAWSDVTMFADRSEFQYAVVNGEIPSYIPALLKGLTDNSKPNRRREAGDALRQLISKSPAANRVLMVVLSRLSNTVRESMNEILIRDGIK